MDLVLYKKSGAIGDIRFNNPDALNAINREMAGQFKDHLMDCIKDPAVRCVTVQGAGRAFMAGGDLKHFYENLSNIRDVAGGLIEVYHECILLMTGMDKPIVTGVQGAAAGGGIGMALAGDYIIAADTAKFTMAYTGIGTSPDGGSTYLLPRLIGRRAALEMALLNKPIDAPRALALGMVNDVVAEDALQNTVEDVAKKLANGSAKALGNAKRLVNESLESTSLQAHLAREKELFLTCAVTGDFEEGLQAFFEKRPPKFSKMYT